MTFLVGVNTYQNWLFDQIPWAFRYEWEDEELQCDRDGGESKEGGPEVLRAQEDVQPEDVADQDARGDRQLVDHAQLAADVHGCNLMQV